MTKTKLQTASDMIAEIDRAIAAAGYDDRDRGLRKPSAIYAIRDAVETAIAGNKIDRAIDLAGALSLIDPKISPDLSRMIAVYEKHLSQRPTLYMV